MLSIQYPRVRLGVRVHFIQTQNRRIIPGTWDSFCCTLVPPVPRLTLYFFFFNVDTCLLRSANSGRWGVISDTRAQRTHWFPRGTRGYREGKTDSSTAVVSIVGHWGAGDTICTSYFIYSYSVSVNPTHPICTRLHPYVLRYIHLLYVRPVLLCRRWLFVYIIIVLDALFTYRYRTTEVSTIHRSAPPSPRFLPSAGPPVVNKVVGWLCSVSLCLCRLWDPADETRQADKRL